MDTEKLTVEMLIAILKTHPMDMRLAEVRIDRRKQTVTIVPYNEVLHETLDVILDKLYKN